jgi:hypothetical protein
VAQETRGPNCGISGKAPDSLTKHIEHITRDADYRCG